MTYTLTAAPITHMNPLDVHALYKLRVDVFVHEQQCPYAEIDDTDALDSTGHILAFDDDTRGIVVESQDMHRGPAAERRRRLGAPFPLRQKARACTGGQLTEAVRRRPRCPAAGG